MARNRPDAHRAPIAREYIAELRRRVEVAGIGAVAVAAGVGRTTLWRMLSGGGDQRPTLDGLERVRVGLAKVEDATVEPMPPPVAAVKSASHWRWIAMGDALDAPALDALMASLRTRQRSRK